MSHTLLILKNYTFFKMFKWFFDYLYWFQIFKDQWGSVTTIPVAVLDWCHILHSKEHSSHSLSNFKYFSFLKGIPSRMEWSACRSSNFDFTTTCNARRFDRTAGMFKRYLLQIFKQLSNPSLFHSFFFPYFHGQNKYRESPLSTVSLSTVPGFVRFSNSTKGQ